MFLDLNTVLETARDSLVHVSKELLTKNSDDFHFFESARSRNLSATTTDAVDAHSSDFDSNALGILERLEGLASKEKYAIMTYSEAIDVLERSPKVFSHPVHWGAPLQTEHEKFLAEEHVGTQVFIIHYPKKIKPFYMKQSGFQRDRETVAAMDLLVPGVGEIIGGSQRIDKVEELEEAINIHGLNAKDYQWYLDIRRFGSVPHGGFGLGFDRFIQYVTGVNNIRDVVLIPRALGTLPF